MPLNRKTLSAAVEQIDQAATDWERLAQVCKQAGDEDGVQVFTASANEADRYSQALIKYAATPQAETVARNVGLKMAALDQQEEKYRLQVAARKFRGTLRGLQAMMRLHGWSEEDSNRAYEQMRKKRPIADGLTASAAPRPALAPATGNARQDRMARMTRRPAAAAAPVASVDRFADLLTPA